MGRSGALACPVQPVTGVAEAGKDVAVVVQAIVDCRGIDIDLRVPLL